MNKEYYEKADSYEPAICKTKSPNVSASGSDELLRLEATIEKQNTENGLYAAQIDLAKREGKDGFDRDKYAINA
jgi:hypothetical protein